MTRYYDNLFNAIHRQQMIDEYGMTEAEFVTIEDLEKYSDVSR